MPALGTVLASRSVYGSHCQYLLVPYHASLKRAFVVESAKTHSLVCLFELKYTGVGKQPIFKALTRARNEEESSSSCIWTLSNRTRLPVSEHTAMHGSYRLHITRRTIRCVWSLMLSLGKLTTMRCRTRSGDRCNC
jgi:hypothetical protein